MKPTSRSKLNSTPKSRKGKGSAKLVHPFSSATVENSFYFLQTAPELYSASDYFKTFDPSPSDKRRLHSEWAKALNILLDSPEQLYADRGNRLQSSWKSPGNGLGSFWEERQDAETLSDVEDNVRINIRKHSLRSVERNVLGAMLNVDDLSRSKRVRRKDAKGHGKEGSDPEQATVENNRKGSHLDNPHTGSRTTKDDDALYAQAGRGPLEDRNERLIIELDVSHPLRNGACEVSGVSLASRSECATGSDNGDSEGCTLDIGEDDLLSQKSTETECDRTRALSKGIYYLTGNGSTDCSEDLWTPWFIDDHDVAPALWKYRQGVIDTAQRVAPLTSSVERLAVNHIYLFQQSDVSSTLFDAIGLDYWRTITSVQIKKAVDDTAMLELQKLAFEISNLSYREAGDHIMSWKGNTTMKKALAGLIEDDFLWSSEPFNEHELLIHVFDPFLKAYICDVTGSLGRWDQVFPPSQNRKKGLDGNSLGRRPDFMLRTALRGFVCYLFFMEAKKARQGTSIVQDDLEKLAGMMKDSIDDMSKQGIDVSKLEVIGLHIVGTEGRLYAMKLEARGIYALRSIGHIYTPRSHFDFGVLATTFNLLMHVQWRLEESISGIIENHSKEDQRQDLTRPGFNTPTRVFKA